MQKIKRPATRSSQKSWPIRPPLKKQKEEILQSSTDANRVSTRMKQAEEAIENTAQSITEWNENAVRQTVERVTVLSADEVLVRIKGGAEIKQRLER